MIETLENIDIELFKVLNGLHTQFLDYLMWLISGKVTWLLLYLAVAVVAFRRGWRRGVTVVLLLAVTVTLCDQISSTFIKHAVERLRPTHTPGLAETVHTVNGYLSGQFGFVSSHAANTLGCAALLSLLTRRKAFTVTVFVWALLVSYSRVYLGVHFPGDVICGGLLGILIGCVVYAVYKWAIERRAGCPPFSPGEAMALVVATAANAAILAAVAVVQFLAG